MSIYDKQHEFDRGVVNPEGKTRLRSPIPSDPGYGPDCRSSGPTYVLRLHGSDAKAIYKRATACDGAPYLLHFRCSQNVPHQTEKNHLNENVKRIRRIMRETQKRQIVKAQSAPVPVKALWHSKQYDHIESKVKQRLEEDKHQSSSRPQSAQANFLRAHKNTGPEFLRSQSASDFRRNSLSESIDKTKIIEPDYIKINSRYVKTIPKVRKTTSTEVVEQTQKKREKIFNNYQEKQNGRVPEYIEKIREKRDQIYDARYNGFDPECPPDHVKVDSTQRIATLEQLKINREQFERKLGHLPIRNDSIALRQNKQDILNKLAELDQAIEIFSKPKVFIKLEE